MYNNNTFECISLFWIVIHVFCILWLYPHTYYVTVTTQCTLFPTKYTLRTEHAVFFDYTPSHSTHASTPQTLYQLRRTGPDGPSFVRSSLTKHPSTHKHKTHNWHAYIATKRTLRARCLPSLLLAPHLERLPLRRASIRIRTASTMRSKHRRWPKKRPPWTSIG